jgi:DNA (cytosine-5)-methyltransferase 1
MRTGTIKAETSVVEEPQLDILYYPKTSLKTSKDAKNETLNVLSLFSGCGGMDLGFEGGFSVLQSSINEKLTPHFIDKETQKWFCST